MKRLGLILLLALAIEGRANTNTSSPLPIFNPGTEILSWDGKSWDITNNRLFESRFEKYLSVPSDTNQDTTEHFKLLNKIRELLSPTHVSIQSREEAFRLLEQASEYEADDLLSDAIGNQVYSAWLAQKNTALLHSASDTLEKEKKRLEWNMRVASEGDGLNHPAASGGKSQMQLAPNSKQALELQQMTARLAEINLLLKSNHIKEEISLTQAKTEFQILIVQLFLQRRFQHVLIATRFYRAIFSDGASHVHMGEEAQKLFSRTTGSAPTLASLDSLSGEMMSNAHDGVSAFRTLMANQELESATKRLSEAFLIGEYMTSLDVVSMQEKHQALVFLQRSRQLISALEVKDYMLAEELVNKLRESAKDFDTSKANAAIQTAKSLAGMHLSKARNAASAGDKKTLEEELNAATEIWPTNPALAEMASGIYNESNVQARAIAEFDQFVGQRNWRHIYNERMRFIPALANHPEKQARMQQILENIGVIDRTIERAHEFAKKGENAGAWETVEIIYRQYPEEYPRLTKARAELTAPAADYVQAVRTAERLEAEGEWGSSMLWYLKAENLYPDGELPKAGIQRLNHLILPDSW